MWFPLDDAAWPFKDEEREAESGHGRGGRGRRERKGPGCLQGSKIGALIMAGKKGKKRGRTSCVFV